MTDKRRHTSREFRAAIEWLESRGWSINAGGTITRVRMQTKQPTYDLRAKHESAARYPVCVDGTTYSIKASDLVTAKFDPNIRKPEKSQKDRRAVAARERPDEAKVGLRLDLEPETRTAPAGLGRCARCGGQVVGRISYPDDPPERRCVQCGRSEVPLAYSQRRSIYTPCVNRKADLCGAVTREGSCPPPEGAGVAAVHRA